MSCLILGIYEQLGLKFTKKEKNYLQKRLFKYQPFLYQVDIFLIKNTRRARKILSQARRNKENEHPR